MGRVRWCEKCDNKALPDTVPPRCKEHKAFTEAQKRSSRKDPDGIPCKGKTKFDGDCSFNAKEGDPDNFCSAHAATRDGTFHLSKQKVCKFNSIDGCTTKAARGKDVCIGHIANAEERAKERKRRNVELTTGSLRMRQLMLGEITTADLDDEELLKGQFKDSAGGFRGRPPEVIPKALHDRMVAELFARTDKRMQARLFDVIDTMINIATSKYSEDKDKIKAATFIFERMRGKTPEVLQVTQDKPFMVMFDKIVAGARSTKFVPNEIGEAVDADIVEDEDED